LNGHLIGQGSAARVASLEVEDMIAFVWWFFTREAEPKERAAFEARLWRPPTPTTPIPVESPWSPEREMAAFSALKAETGA